MIQYGKFKVGIKKWFPWTEEPGGLQSIGSQRVGHNKAQHSGGGL